MSQAVRPVVATPGSGAAAGPSDRSGGYVRCLVYDAAGLPRPLTDLAAISDVLSDAGSFVWFDAVHPEAADFALIQHEFNLHPLAVEDASREHDRPKIEAYGDAWFLLVDGVTRSGSELAIHELAIFVGARFVVTMRMNPAFPLDEVERRWENLPSGVRRDSGAMLYTVLDTLVDGFAPVAEALEDEVDALETTLLGKPHTTDDVLLAIYSMQNEVNRLRRAVAPLREIIAPIMRGNLALFGADELPYYRDIYDHVNHAIDQMDNAREIIKNARDTHMSMATHRQSEVTKQLTIVATVFMPLTFITGFFGQNFGWLVNHIEAGRTFAIWGIGSEVAAVMVLLAYFRYKRWS